MVIDMQLITLSCKSSLIKQSLGVPCLTGHENNFMVSQLNDRFLMTPAGGCHKEGEEGYVDYYPSRQTSLYREGLLWYVYDDLYHCLIIF